VDKTRSVEADTDERDRGQESHNAKCYSEHLYDVSGTQSRGRNTMANLKRFECTLKFLLVSKLSE
jgi:hypothetical protein